MNTTKSMAWLLLAVGAGLGALALNSRAQTASAVPMTTPQASTTPAAPAQAAPATPPVAENKPAPASSTAPAAAPGAAIAQSGSGQGSPATMPVNSTPAPASAPVPTAASTSASTPAPAPKPPQTALTPAGQRITDQAIRGDMAFIRSYQARLKGLNDSGDNPNSAYHYAKALHWVDFALDEYEMKNRSGVIEQALNEGGKLIEALEQKRSAISMDTPILPLSEKLRNDLWAAAGKLKADKDGFKCAGGDVARLEVQLVWAGHIQRDLGWRSAKPHLQAAERYHRDALAGAQVCPRAVAAGPGQAAPASPAAQTKIDDAALAKLPPAKQIEILADRVHFAYDRSSISGATAPILDRVASLLRVNAAISVTIEGHADERGSERYNVTLSQRRADAVRAYLIAAGVAPARMKTVALGKSKPEVKAENIEGHALNRRVVFVPSSTADMQINRQREDLQLKGDPVGGRAQRK